MSDTTEQTNEKAKEMRRFIGRLAYYATPIYRSLQERNQEDEWFSPLTRFMLDVIHTFCIHEGVIVAGIPNDPMTVNDTEIMPYGANFYLLGRRVEECFHEHGNGRSFPEFARTSEDFDDVVREALASGNGFEIGFLILSGESNTRVFEL